MPREIEFVDTRTASDEILREMWLYYHEIYAEDLPDDPPVPFARQRANWRKVFDIEYLPRWVVREEGRIVAVALAWMDLEQDLDNCFARIHVTKLHRGRGLAKLLAGPVLGLVEERGRKKVITSTNEHGGDLAPLLTRLGLKDAYHETRSRLLIAEVDHNLMQSWISRAAERASGYELLFVDSPIPDELLDALCEIFFQMNTAPMEDLDVEDEVLTPSRWREIESKSLAGESEIHILFAVEKQTGQFVGMTSLETDLLYPAQGRQWDTVVHPDHRNRGIGRWIKAAMIEHVIQRYPEMERVDTENSVTNDPMIAINVEMGFRPVSRMVIWQGAISNMRANWPL